MSNKKVVAFGRSSEELLSYAYKKIEKKDYVGALAILKNANEQEPENVDVLLEMAELYGLLGYTEKANACAYYAMLKKPNKESLYILGANYLKSYQYETGKRFLTKLVKEYPQDEYADFAQEILTNIDTNDVLTDEMRMLRLSDKGKHLIEAGKYKKAVRLYQRLNDINDSATYIKNNLALSYFYDNEEQMAIELCKEVLSDNPYDVYANCNLVLFYYKTKQEFQLQQQLKRLKRLQPNYNEEYIKMVATFCEMDEHEAVLKYLEQLQQRQMLEAKTLYLLAAANYNVGKVSKAIDILSNILKMDEFNYISYYYLKVIKSEVPPLKMEYYMQIPFLAILDSIKKVKQLMVLSKEDLLKDWTRDDMMVAIWGLYYGDDGLKKLCVNLLASVGDEDCETVLREFLFRINERDEVKKEVFSALQFMGAEQPYIAFFSDTVVEVNVSLVESDIKNLSSRDHRVIALIKEKVGERMSEQMAEEGLSLFLQIVEKDRLSQCNNSNALAACIEYLLRIKHENELAKTDLSKVYGASMQTINRYLNQIDKIIIEKLEEIDKEQEQKDQEGKDELDKQ